MVVSSVDKLNVSYGSLAKSSKQKVIILFLSFYAFLSGFVFIEPSPAEILFVIFVALLLIRLKFNLHFMLETLIILFFPLFTSTLSGLFQDGFINVRFIVIDLYLFGFYFILVSAIMTERLNSIELIKTVMKYWTLAALINIFAGLYCYATGKQFLFGVDVIKFGIRLKGFFKDPNVFGPFAVVPFVFHLDVLIKERINLKRLFLVILLGLGIVLSFSRAAWLNAAVSTIILIGYYVAINVRKHSKRNVLVLVVIMIFLISVGWKIIDNVEIMNTKLSDFMLARFGLQKYDEERFGAQSEMVEILESRNVLFGIGPGKYEDYAGMATHSLYIRYLGERGLISFVIFVIWLVHKAKLGKRSPLKIFLLSTLVGQMINSFFIDSLHWRHFWILFVFLTVVKLEYKNMENVSPKHK